MANSIDTKPFSLVVVHASYSGVGEAHQSRFTPNQSGAIASNQSTKKLNLQCVYGSSVAGSWKALRLYVAWHTGILVRGTRRRNPSASPRALSPLFIAVSLIDGRRVLSVISGRPNSCVRGYFSIFVFPPPRLAAAVLDILTLRARKISRAAMKGNSRI